MGKKLVIEQFDDDDFSGLEEAILDRECLEDGIDIEVLPGHFFRCSYAGPENRKYRIKLAELSEEYGLNPEEERLNEEEALFFMQKVFVESVILGWRGFKTKTGKDKPYSKYSAMAVFQQSPNIWQTVYRKASEFAEFAIARREKAGNA